MDIFLRTYFLERSCYLFWKEDGLFPEDDGQTLLVVNVWRQDIHLWWGIGLWPLYLDIFELKSIFFPLILQRTWYHIKYNDSYLFSSVSHNEASKYELWKRLTRLINVIITCLYIHVMHYYRYIILCIPVRHPI